MKSETPQETKAKSVCPECSRMAEVGSSRGHSLGCYIGNRVFATSPEEPQTEATPGRPSAELTVKQAIKRTKEWRESSELAIAPEIITALLEAAEGYDSAAAQIATLKAENEKLTAQYNTLDADWRKLDDKNEALEKALRGLCANRVRRDSPPCWCPLNHLTELTTVEETGKHEASCTAAHAALGEPR